MNLTKTIYLTLTIWIVAVAITSANAAERRVAFLVGNGAYTTETPLAAAPNDARDMDAALRGLGFETVLVVDGTIGDIAQGLQTFKQMMEGADVALFYYAGHGAQVDGVNYLVAVEPPDYDAEEDSTIFRAQEVLENMENSSAKVKLLIMDACRVDPTRKRGVPATTTTARSTSPGLAPMKAPVGTVIAYSCSPNTSAAERLGARNGDYTGVLLRHIATPDLPIEEMFKQVRQEMIKVSGGKQVPWEHSSLIGDFTFRGSVSGTDPALAVGVPGENASVYYRSIAQQLVALLPPSDRPLRIAFGQIIAKSAEGEGQTAMSLIVADELKRALVATGRVQLIADSRLDELMEMGEFQQYGILHPDTPAVPVKISAVDAVIRGYYFACLPRIRVSVDLVTLDGAVSYPGSGFVPVADGETSLVLPPAQVESFVQEQGAIPAAAASRDNRESAQRIADMLPNDVLKVEVWPDGNAPVYRAGDRVSFKVRAKQDCYVAIISHTVDGASTVLFPNEWNADTAVKAGQVVSVPGDKAGFKFPVQAPFGADVIQVIACSDKAALEALLSRSFGPQRGNLASVTDRPALEKGIKGFGVEPDNASHSWGQSFIIVNTLP